MKTPTGTLEQLDNILENLKSHLGERVYRVMSQDTVRYSLPLPNGEEVHLILHRYREYGCNWQYFSKPGIEYICLGDFWHCLNKLTEEIEF